MGAPQRKVLSEPGSQSPRAFGTDPYAWAVLVPAGLLFFLVGSLDVMLAWHPFGFGNPEWEFATVTSTLNGLPAPTIGLTLILAGVLGLGRYNVVRAVAVVLIVIAVLVLVAAIMYATNIPIALQSVQGDPLARIGLRKAILKTTGQAILYPSVLIWIAVVSLKWVKRLDRAAKTV